jgi:hypothetical protein
MSSEIKANKISPATGTALQISDSGDTTTVPSGATLDVSSATMTGFTIPSGQTLTVASGATLDTTGATVSGLTTGKVLQVVQTVKTDTFTTTSGTLVDITGLSASITPSATSSKILVSASVWAGTALYVVHLALFRDSTEIGKADAAGSRPVSFLDVTGSGESITDGQIMQATGELLDSPATTSSVTYQIKGARRYDNSGHTLYINRSYQDRDIGSTYDQRKVSTVTLWEIGA